MGVEVETESKSAQNKNYNLNNSSIYLDNPDNSNIIQKPHFRGFCTYLPEKNYCFC